LQHGRAILRQFSLHPLERCHARGQVGEQLVYLVGDTRLLGQWRKRERKVKKGTRREVLDRNRRSVVV
jgi:hypothetical protein